MADNKRILVVDDDHEITRGLSYRLKSKNYLVDIANSGEQGLEMATALQPQAIILDIRMPDLDGLAVLSRLKQNPLTASISVIMCSASLVDQKDALDRGATFFIKKPFDAPALLAALEAATSQPQQGAAT